MRLVVDMRIRSEEYKRKNNECNKKRYHTKYKLCKNHRTNAYRYTLKKSYNLTEDDYIILFNGQEGLCLICKATLYNPFDRKDGERPHVDHCHVTNKVRGLLCGNCNVGLGSFKDNQELLIKAARYLNEKGNI